VKSVIRVRGVLKGMDRKAACILLTWKETSTTGRVYTRCRIVDEPSDLPDGPYTLSFARLTLSTRKLDDCWMLTFLPPEIDLERAA
jgi:hypothetical protein